MIYDTSDIPIKRVQIDFICTDDVDTFAFACHMLDWNDTCCIMGGIISQCFQVPGRDGRLKLCDKSLKYMFSIPQDKSRKYHEIVLSTDFYEILDKLGFNVEVHKRGFDTEKDVFAFLIDNPHFDAQVFIEYPLNGHKTKRIQRRSMRTAFTEYLKAPSRVPVAAGATKALPLPFPLFERFPNLPAQMKTLKIAVADACHRKTIITSKFNGHMVRERCGVAPQQMSAWMKRIVTSTPHWEEFVFHATEEKVWNHINALMAEDRTP
mmetsp:Transcript_30866/g.80954  ORF Transcript_30866/g.80954 Transcript_30866/m.80954 type:complete len:265 (-) Transcript_30866:1305-2099(-)